MVKNHRETRGNKPGIFESPRRLRRARIQSLAFVLLLTGLLLPLLAPAPTMSAAQESAQVTVLTIDGTITNVTRVYVDRGMEQAIAEGAAFVLISLRSAGGDAAAANSIVAAIDESPVPVIVFVPDGGRVQGAAVAVLISGHVSSMAPNAIIGDTSRIAVGDAEPEAQATSLLAGIATDRGRSTKWIEGSTTPGFAMSGDQAKADGVIDVVASDQDQVLAAIDGRTVTLGGGQQVTLAMEGVTTSAVGMTMLERVRAFITSPSVAYVLLCFGVLGLFLELASPGGFVAGTIGIVCLGVAIYAFSTLPINGAGLGLMALAFVLLGVDLFVTSFGILTVAGLASFVIGSYIVIDTDIVGYDPVSRPVIWTAAACVIAFAAFIGLTAIRSLRRPPVTGRRAMVGEIGRVRDVLDPYGMIFVQGELWQAHITRVPAGHIVPIGAQVEIIDVQGLLLTVIPATEAAVQAAAAKAPLADARRVLPVLGGVRGLPHK